MGEFASLGPIFLVGMMGAGKSRVGRLLAQRTQRVFIDLDEMIETLADQSIAEIFTSQGEAAFRNLESRALDTAIAEHANAVIATGGGIVVREQNLSRMRERGVSIYLDVPASELLRRLSTPEERQKRPLLGTRPAKAARRPDDDDSGAGGRSVDATAPEVKEPPPQGDLREVIDALLAARRVRYEASQWRVDASPAPLQVVESIVARLAKELEGQSMSAEQQDPGTGRKSKPIAINVDVPTDDLGYSVLVGPGLLDRVATQIRRLHPAAQKIALVSDGNVMPLYGDELREQLLQADYEVHDFVVPPGEESKSQERLFELVNGFVAAGLSRRDVVVPLGGGVVGDLAGLAAATFMRGISFLQVPTSLLAQVDSSVGGKVAIDIPGGKNLFGAFHFPTAVIIDPRVLRTLDDRELGCGLGEMLKHAALFSAEHFEALQAAGDGIYDRDLELLSRLSATSVAYKAACVARDPLEHAEAGKGRVLLNLGHTVGHAIESMSNFECKHGEAVALGLRAAARVSERCGAGEAGLEDRMVKALKALRLPTDLDPWLEDSKREAMIEYLGRDKKRRDQRISYIALARIAEPRVMPLSSEDIVSLLSA